MAMNIQTGVDILEIDRVREILDRYGDRFLEKIYTSRERNEYQHRAEALAVCFAAKEAAVKALGTGIGPVDWREVEILHHRSGKPYLILHKRAESFAKALGLTGWSVSLSHSREFAVAVVVAVGDS